MRRVVEVGQRFGLWLVIAEGQRGNRQLRWLCRCDCGTEREVYQANLRSGGSTNCGCSVPDAAAVRATRHGMRRSPEYAAWTSMKQRCTNPARPEWKHYGGRGIRVCDEWLESFEAFYAYVGPRPNADLSIDRIDNDGNYEPGNVRWATLSEQNRNQRRWAKAGVS